MQPVCKQMAAGSPGGHFPSVCYFEKSTVGATEFAGFPLKYSSR
jgi:hypothetical protein